MVCKEDVGSTGDDNMKSLQRVIDYNVFFLNKLIAVIVQEAQGVVKFTEEPSLQYGKKKRLLGFQRVLK